MIFTVLLLLGVVLSKPDVWINDMMIPENGTDNNMLGICYGSNTVWGSFPWTVALRYPGTGSACCSGSIISLNPGIILTAAHCNACTGGVRIGCSNPLNCNGDSYAVSQFVQNPSYQSPLGFSNDIGIVLLSSPITTDGAQSLTVPSVQPSLGTLRVTSYGQDESGNIPTQLKTMQTNEYENSECAATMSQLLGSTQVDGTMLCMFGGTTIGGSDNNPTMCFGDSGGGVVVGNNVYGANSWVLSGSGGPCSGCGCCKGYPQVAASTTSSASNSFINEFLSLWKAKYTNITNIPVML